MPITRLRFTWLAEVQVFASICLLALCCAQGQAQTPAEPTLLWPFNQVEIDPAKRAKALTATQEYQDKDKELKANTALPSGERQKQLTANYHAYLKKMEGQLSKDQREKARTMLVEKDVKGLRDKPALPRFYDQLSLSEEQATKAKDLNLQQRIKTQTLYHSGNYAADERAEESKYISEEFTKKFNDLLTTEQRAKLADLRKQATAIAAVQVPPLYQKLGLNTAQTDKLKQLLFEMQNKMAALTKDTSLKPDARQQQSNALNAEANSNAEALLNKDQKLKLEDLIREANYRMPAFYAPLELTVEQQTKLKETILWQAHEMAVLKLDTKLTPEQRQDRQSKINQGMQERFTGFMSPEQITKLNGLLREMQTKPQGPKSPEHFD